MVLRTKKFINFDLVKSADLVNLYVLAIRV